ncbi:MAG: oligoribonuclease [Myxococcales bacterium]|nr:oligoribonuclease [Myxococcales bacterium]MCB9643405.1 oligoribonuclease [Myxococcales bacterium]
MATEKETNLIWMDLEMTGLDVRTCTILEIATLVTDAQLNLIAEGPVFAIHQPDEVLEAMDEWNTTHHGQSGLLERVRNSRVSLEEAEEQTLAFLKEHTLQRKSPLCGNTIFQDRLFLLSYMPKLEAYCHYRNVDVSSIKELARRWYPNSMQAPPKKQSHLALDDIRESVEELRYYRKHLFVPTP